MRIFFICCCLMMCNILVAQDVLTVGVSSTSSSLKSIIKKEGFHIHVGSYEKINKSTLADKDIVVLFNLRQTWNKQAIFTQAQTIDLIKFVENGGVLYLTARKGYNNLLVQLGVVLEGNDGGSTGRDWPLVMEKVTRFSPHPLTKKLEEVKTDVSAKFTADENWKVLATTDDLIPMLAIRTLGAGQIILGAGERIFRDPCATKNRYETDIEQADNYQYHLNLFSYLKEPTFETQQIKIPEKESFHIFPNPTTQKITIVGEQIIAIDVVNVQGQLLHQYKFVNEDQVSLDLGDLAPALYFLKIRTLNGAGIEEVVLK